ncbi:adenylyl-sulfate kinase [Chitinilyticum litopenaei]|uniref:adenylyl-sulfate kinase n=1 Tax=Chitinilyticum litopenaei TaxID=1121276 RepID=UPI000401501E|nr:adenylyl-sulfate kinase [Chitinilyticum litopenaei]
MIRTPHTWWLTGLPCAGKTTLANALAERLRAQGQAVCVLDGDVLRAGVASDLGFSPADREEQARRTAEMARLINRNGIHAIVALVSPTRSGRALARDIIGTARFSEVYLATPLAVCRQRDVKGWYARAEIDPALALTGVSAPYEAPQRPELTIDTSITNIELALAQILSNTQNQVMLDPCQTIATQNP